MSAPVGLAEFAKLLAEADPGSHEALFKRAQMLAMNLAPEEAFEAPISTLGEYMARPITIPPVLIAASGGGALLVRGSILCTVGRAGKGKTQMNLNRAFRLAAGLPMFKDYQDTDGKTLICEPERRPLRTLIIENEGAAGMFHKQVGLMLNAKDFVNEGMKKKVEENILIWGDGGYSGLKLDDEALANQVRAGIEKHEPDILFIEPFRGLWKGDENSATDMGIVADVLSSIASDYDLGVVLTHHERKSGTSEDGEKMSAGRGSTVLEGVVATMENFEVAKGGDYRELSWSKIRYGGGHPMLPVRMEWQPGAWWYRHVPLEETENSILSVLAANPDEPMTIKGIIDLTDEKEHTIRKTLKALSATGKVKRMESVHGPGGSTGHRYRIAVPTTEDGPSDGGMEF